MSKRGVILPACRRFKANHHGLSGLNILTNSIDVARLLSGKQSNIYHRYEVHLLSGDVRQVPWKLGVHPRSMTFIAIEPMWFY